MAGPFAATSFGQPENEHGTIELKKGRIRILDNAGSAARLRSGMLTDSVRI